MNCEYCDKPMLYAQVPVDLRGLFNDGHIHCTMYAIQKMVDDSLGGWWGK